MPTKMDGFGIVSVAAGVIFAWGGIKGFSPLKAVENIITGKNPNESQSSTSLTGSSSNSATSAGVGNGQVLATYSNAQLQSLWIANGGASDKAATAACIAIHESSGIADETSSNPDGGINVGLWQLDTKGKGAGHTEAQLKDPNTNAKLAIVGSSNGTDWSAWATAPLCGV